MMTINKSKLHKMLTGAEPAIPAEFLYDSIGWPAYLKLCESPEYGLRRAELSLLDRHLSDHRGASTYEYIDLGGGDGSKLLGGFENTGCKVKIFSVVDTSAVALAAAQARATKNANIESSRMINSTMREYLYSSRTQSPKGQSCFYFLGSSVGNMSASQRRQFFSDVKQAAGNSSKTLVIGYDLLKSPALHLAAYSDRYGYAALSGLNALAQVNRTLDLSIALSDFEHHVKFDADRRDIRTYLRCKNSFRATSADGNFAIEMFEGDVILTNCAHKFDHQEIETEAANAGIEIADIYLDRTLQYELIAYRMG